MTTILSSSQVRGDNFPILHVDVDAPAGADAADAAMLPSFDATDPTALYAYFQTQMRDVRSKLSSLMTEQEQRNKRCTALQQASATLTQFAESGVKPGDKGWNDFLAAAQRAKTLLGDGSKEAAAVQALVDRATAKQQRIQDKMLSPHEADALRAQGATVYQVPGPELFGSDQHLYTVITMDGDPPPVSADEVKSMIAGIKATTDGLQSEASMQMIRVQQLVDQSSQIVNLCSNVIRKLDDMRMAAISNIRG